MTFSVLVLTHFTRITQPYCGENTHHVTRLWNFLSPHFVTAQCIGCYLWI